MSYFILIIVVVLFYFLTRGYKTENYNNINLNRVQKLRGSLKEHEAGLLVALMAKVAKADGRVSELEAELLSHTFTDISKVFENPNEIREELKKIYNLEKESFENTIVVAKKYLNLTKRFYIKRLKIMEYLLNLAFIDGEFSKEERMITEDIANALEIKKADFELLVRQFEQFYANKKQQEGMSLQKAYETLGLSEGVDFATVKKEYRRLVRKNHPDILMGQGKEQSIIDEATKKLQEINEAYELIKKNLVK
jgi:DnaJ like chaperone protein